jgi:hypothetical protein
MVLQLSHIHTPNLPGPGGLEDRTAWSYNAGQGEEAHVTNPNDPICYLCGLPVPEKEISLDHLPPRQVYGASVRRTHGPNLFSLPTHKTCNTSFQKDEDYFVNALVPIANTYSARSVLDDIQDRVQKGKQVPLFHQVLKEFERTPSGLTLPGGRVFKRVDGIRAARVIWKIIRGLFFKEKGTVLPESTFYHSEIVSPGIQPPDYIALVINEPKRGDYAGVFDYRFVHIPEADKNKWLWAFLLWDNIIVVTLHHDPTCACQECITAPSAATPA